MANTNITLSPATRERACALSPTFRAMLTLDATGLDDAARERAARAYGFVREGHVDAALAALDGYTVRMCGGEHIITNPGQMESNPTWVRTLWGLALDGCADATEWDGETEISVFNVDDATAVRFPTLRGCRKVRLWQDDNGFVCYRESVGR